MWSIKYHTIKKHSLRQPEIYLLKQHKNVMYFPKWDIYEWTISIKLSIKSKTKTIPYNTMYRSFKIYAIRIVHNGCIRQDEVIVKYNKPNIKCLC